MTVQPTEVPSKKELRVSLNVSRPTFNKMVRKVLNKPNCPFSENCWFNRERYIEQSWYLFFLSNY